MKTTGRIELTQANPEFYFIDDIVHYNNIPALHVNNITDIREEVDWSKVKRNAIVAAWQEYSEPAGAEIKFYRGRANGGFQIAPWKTYDGKPEYYECAMPLDQWRKKHGGQDE